MRTDLYTLIHKAQRFHLFHLANEIGATDFKNSDAAKKLSDRIEDMIEHLRDHSRNEESYIHPLFREMGAAVGENFEKEHHYLEEEIEKIEEVLKQARWDDLYFQYSRFLGIYLTHLSEEETAQRDILWQHYDDQALMAVFNRFKSERSPQAAKADLELMLPALSIPELTRIYSGMKASAPPMAFKGACELAAQVLGTEKWQELKGRL